MADTAALGADLATLSPTEAMMWHAEASRRVFHPWFGALILLDRDPDPAAFEAAVAVASERLPRLTHSVTSKGLGMGLPTWHAADKVDPRYHVRRLRLGADADLDNVLETLSVVVSLPMDRGRPLWECYLIGPFDGSRAACFVKLHAALIDSVDVAEMLTALASPRASRRERSAVGHTNGASRWSTGARETWRLARGAVSVSARALRHPVASIETLWRGARELPDAMSDAAESFAREIEGSNQTGAVRKLDLLTLPVADLEDTARPLGVTADDLLLSALTAALRALRPPAARRVTETNCLARVRRIGGSGFAFGSIAVPFGERRADRRLALIRDARQALSGNGGGLSPLLAQTLGLLPRLPGGWLAGVGLGRPDAFFADAGVCTSMPKLAGAGVDAVYGFGDFAEAGSLGATVIQRGALCHIGIAADSDLVRPSVSLPGLLTAALEELGYVGRTLRARRAPVCAWRTARLGLLEAAASAPRSRGNPRTRHRRHASGAALRSR